MNNLVLRSITGVLFAFVVLGSILWGPYSQAIVFSIFMVLGLLEFYTLFNTHSFVQVSKEKRRFYWNFYLLFTRRCKFRMATCNFYFIYFPFIFHLNSCGIMAKKRTSINQYKCFSVWNPIHCYSFFPDDRLKFKKHQLFTNCNWHVFTYMDE